MRTFLDVFPDATLWFDGNLMVGSLAPLPIDPATFAAKRAHPKTAAALDDIGLRSFETLAGWYTAGPDEMRRFVGGGTAARPTISRSSSTTDRCRPAMRRWTSPRCEATSRNVRSAMVPCSNIDTLFLDAGGVLVHPSWARVSAALATEGVEVSAASACSAPSRFAKRDIDEASGHRRDRRRQARLVVTSTKCSSTPACLVRSDRRRARSPARLSRPKTSGSTCRTMSASARTVPRARSDAGRRVERKRPAATPLRSARI